MRGGRRAVRWRRIAWGALGLALVASTLPRIAEAATAIDIRVASGSDDVEEYLWGEMYLDSSDLELVTDGSNTQSVGLRFTDLGIPGGAVVTAAWVQFQTDETSNSPTTLRVYAEAGPAGPFRKTSRDVTSRTLTTASVEWLPAGWDTVGAVGAAQRTPDLSIIIQQAVDSAQWDPTASLALVITGSGSRVASSYEGSSGGAALLHVEYNVGGPRPNTAPVVDAGPDRVVTPGGQAVLAGSITDDGLPDPPASVTAAWTQVSGPGAASFTDASAASTAATFSEVGTYTLRLTGYDGEFSGSDGVTVTVIDSSTASTVRFAAIADFGTGSSGELDVANLIDAEVVDFIVTAGDNAYFAPIDYAIGQFYAPYIGDYVGAYGPGSPVNRFFPSLGNHDYAEGLGLPGYLDYFTLPGAGIVSSATAPSERYYDFVQGPVHFFAINSNPEEPDGITSASTQAQWLQSALAASTAPWKIVYFHHSPYSSSIHGPTADLQWPFAAWGADVVVTGHDHVYERIIHDGIPYFITGLAGGSSYKQSLVWPESQFFYNEDAGALIIEACAARIEFEFHTVSSGIVDTYAEGAASCDGTPALSVVTAAATDPNAAEDGADPGVVSVARSGDTSTSLTVSYAVSGTATPADYEPLAGWVTIPTGQASAVVTVTPTDDSEVESDETVVITLQADPAYDVGVPSAGTVTISDDDAPPPLPVVTASATDPHAAEAGADPGAVTVTRTGDTSDDLVVAYAESGTAAATDYQQLSGSVTIQAGQASVDIAIAPFDDQDAESDETVIITLQSDPAYDLGSPSAATVIISDNDQPTITDAFAQGETTIAGTVHSGDFTRTFVSDSKREVIRESLSDGSRATQVSLLEHEWTFQVTPGNTVTFILEAHHSSTSEGDDFTFSYSTGGPFIDMITVTKTTDDSSLQTFELPNTSTGPVTVRVADLDQSPGNRRRDRISIDYMVIRTVD